MSKLVVIGSGSGGLTAAIGLAKVGYNVTIIEKEYIGGDCTNFGCIPSKTILQESKKLYTAYKTLGKKPDKEYNKLAEGVLDKTRGVVNKFRQHESEEWLQSNNVSLVRGKAEFTSPHSLRAGEVDLTFDRCIIATGSRAAIPPIEGLESTPYLTNKTIFDLQKVPKHLVIIGNGVIGVEMGEAFAMLGAKVTIIGRQRGILKNSDPEHKERLMHKLEKLGIEFASSNTNKISYKNGEFSLQGDAGMSVKCDQLLIATGRIPNVDLDLSKAKVKYTQKGIHTKPNTQTTNNKIFAIGDCVAGVPKFTHFAYHMGKTVVANLITEKYLKLPLYRSKIKPELNPSVIFTSTELAEVGLSEKEAKEQFGKVRTFSLDFKDLDRAITNNEEGVIKIITTGFFGRIVGASILAARAGEMLPELQTMITEKKNMLYFNKLIRAYPTYTANLDNFFKQWLYSVVSKKK